MISFGFTKTRGKKPFCFQTYKEKNGYRAFEVIINFIPKRFGFCFWASKQ